MPPCVGVKTFQEFNRVEMNKIYLWVSKSATNFFNFFKGGLLGIPKSNIIKM